MADTSAARTRLYRQRLARELPPVEWFTCSTAICTRLHRGKHGRTCSVCWRMTQEGRDHLAALARGRRGKKSRA